MQHKCVIWFTGLSGSGKTTLAEHLSVELNKININNYILDGDILRKTINNDLSFSDEDRRENIRRVAYISHILYEANVVPIVSCISPFQNDRDFARSLIGDEHFVEIYLDTPLNICELRDIKGLYAQARANEIVDFTGIKSDYEIPDKPNIVIDTYALSIEHSVQMIMQYLKNHWGILLNFN